jgi:hypothetical protein
MWNMRDLSYTFEQDLFSATTFVNTCNFVNLKPNAALEVTPPAFASPPFSCLINPLYARFPPRPRL